MMIRPSKAMVAMMRMRSVSVLDMGSVTVVEAGLRCAVFTASQTVTSKLLYRNNPDYLELSPCYLRCR
jgi:hypothetical protein